jgi:hypothetical protein
MTRLATALIGLTMATTALAQEVSGPAYTYAERTEIDFEGVDVKGELVKPTGSLVVSTRRAQFNPLIRLRENFNTELKRSADQVK